MGNYVSLLPPQYAQKSKLAEIIRKATFAVIVTTAVLFAAVALSVAYRAAGQLEIASVTAETAQVDFQITQLSEIEIRQKEILTLRDVIIGVQSQDPAIAGVLSDVIARLPSGVRINSLSLNVNKDMVLVGSADCTGSTYEDVARFMNSLRESDRVTAVECTDSRDLEGTVAFTLALTFAKQDEEQVDGK